MTANTTPLLASEDEEEEPDLVTEEDDEGPAAATSEQEDDADFLAAFIVWGPAMLFTAKHRRYPAFQTGYTSPARGNPLPARVAQHCPTPELEQKWKELLQELEDKCCGKYQQRRCWFLWGLLSQFVLLAPFILPFWINSLDGTPLIPLLVGMILVGSTYALRSLADNPFHVALKQVVESNNTIWKEQVRIRMRTRKITYPLLPCLEGNSAATIWKCCCCCLYGQDTVLILETYLPPSERQAQIAFV